MADMFLFLVHFSKCIKKLLRRCKVGVGIQGNLEQVLLPPFCENLNFFCEGPSLCDVPFIVLDLWTSVLLHCLLVSETIVLF